jgi:hypothetical protein
MSIGTCFSNRDNMQTFIDYVQDRKQNRLYNFAKKFAQPDYFMSFTEATWQTRNAHDLPNGIPLFPIQDTMHMWEETSEGMWFKRQPQEKIYILRSYAEGAHYTADNYENDIVELKKNSPFTINEKLISSYQKMMKGKPVSLQKEIENTIYREKNKFDLMVEDVTSDLRKPSEKLLEVTKWIASKGRDPETNFTGNASQRWTNTIRQLGYSALSMGEITLFFGTHDLEVIDEIHNR